MENSELPVIGSMQAEAELPPDWRALNGIPTVVQSLSIPIGLSSSPYTICFCLFVFSGFFLF